MTQSAMLANYRTSLPSDNVCSKQTTKSTTPTPHRAIFPSEDACSETDDEIDNTRSAPHRTVSSGDDARSDLGRWDLSKSVSMVLGVSSMNRLGLG